MTEDRPVAAEEISAMYRSTVHRFVGRTKTFKVTILFDVRFLENGTM